MQFYFNKGETGSKFQKYYEQKIEIRLGFVPFELNVLYTFVYIEILGPIFNFNKAIYVTKCKEIPYREEFNCFHGI